VRKKMKREVEYCSCLLNVNIKCDYLKVNMNYEYELSNECMKCRSKVICEKYCYLKNMKSDCVKRSSNENVKSKSKVEILKLNCDYVKLGRRRIRMKNIELIRRIEDMKRNNEKIKVLKI